MRKMSSAFVWGLLLSGMNGLNEISSSDVSFVILSMLIVFVCFLRLALFISLPRFFCLLGSLVSLYFYLYLSSLFDRGIVVGAVCNSSNGTSFPTRKNLIIQIDRLNSLVNFVRHSATESKYSIFILNEKPPKVEQAVPQPQPQVCCSVHLRERKMWSNEILIDFKY